MWREQSEDLDVEHKRKLEKDFTVKCLLSVFFQAQCPAPRWMIFKVSVSFQPNLAEKLLKITTSRFSIGAEIYQCWPKNFGALSLTIKQGSFGLSLTGLTKPASLPPPLPLLYLPHHRHCLETANQEGVSSVCPGGSSVWQHVHISKQFHTTHPVM